MSFERRGNSGSNSNQLVDPSLLEGLNEHDRREALAAAAAAKRAEERAEQRALERAIQQKERERKLEQLQRQQQQKTIAGKNVSAENVTNRVVFVPKNRRGVDTSNDDVKIAAESSKSDNTGDDGIHPSTTVRPEINSKNSPAAHGSKKEPNGNNSNGILSENEMKLIRQTYLGKTGASVGDAAIIADEELARRKKLKFSKKTTFKFRWDETDDTYDDDDPLYASMAPRSSAAAGQYNKDSRYGMSARHTSTTSNNNAVGSNKKRKMNSNDLILGDVSTAETVKTKALNKMTTRDWRILRENYEIVVKGGKAPPPMRSFRESPKPEIPQLHPSLLDAIENVFRFKEPSPIQRQAIPIGLQRRDLIGIAETGSGKTIAFGVPLCHYLLNVPHHTLSSVADNGPLALVMAPTRELALQIDIEFKKLLSKQRTIRTCPIVGGQPIQQQAQEIRNGVHIVVGTPGRINDCIEMAYLVLNQCCYIVMDEADRMIDMGFAPQMESILNAMGGAMKSENEMEAYQQELEDLKHTDVARHRLTAMFSATMPLEVERIAKRYLRHPAIISIGDQDSGKNARIVQKLVWVSSPSKKEEALRTLLRNPRFIREKIIVFVNEKKHADSVGRMVERAGRQCVVLHGGKSQEQREENLEIFRRGGIVMVATDVAGRGLDIPDVAHIINFDLPSRSIENYTHRIGRTGRAGKEGFATSLISDEDEAIMAPLRAYLESTGNEVPDRLARHSSSQGSGPASIMY